MFARDEACDCGSAGSEGGSKAAPRLRKPSTTCASADLHRPAPPRPRPRGRCRYNKDALRLRIFGILHQPAGAESHTVLVQDVPGVAFGTIPQRADGTLLKLIPKSERRVLVAVLCCVQDA